MKPPPFHYVRCTSAAEAAALLSEGGEDAKIIAGGQSLVPLLNFRLARPSLLVDINPLADLAYVRSGAAAELCIGALTRQATLERAGLPSGWDAIAEAIPLVGHYPTRIRGTVGGSVAHADPSAEIPVLCLGFGAQLALVGPRSERSIAADEFFLGPFMTLIEPDEILTEVCLTAPQAGASTAFEEFSERHGDFALVSVFAGMHLTGGTCSWVRIAAGGIGPTPVRASAAEAVLLGSRANRRVTCRRRRRPSRLIAASEMTSIAVPRRACRSLATWRYACSNAPGQNNGSPVWVIRITRRSRQVMSGQLGQNPKIYLSETLGRY